MNSEDLEKFYNLIGKAVWHIQYVEDALCVFIMIVGEIKTPGAWNDEDIAVLVKKNRSFTFGKLLSVAKKKITLSDDLRERLQSFKEERNWLIHRVNHESGNSLYVLEERTLIFSRIEHIYEEARELQAKILNELTKYLDDQGIDSEKIMDEARQKYISLVQSQT